LKRKDENKRSVVGTICIFVIVSVVVGACAGYIVGISGVSDLIKKNDQLKTEYDSLYLAFQGIEVELHSTQELLAEEQRNNKYLMERYREMLIIDRENQAFKQQIIDLELEIAILQDACQDIEDIYSQLNVSYATLEEAFNILQDNYTTLLEETEASVVDLEIVKVSIVGYEVVDVEVRGKGQVTLLMFRIGDKFFMPEACKPRLPHVIDGTEIFRVTLMFDLLDSCDEKVFRTYLYGGPSLDKEVTKNPWCSPE